MEDPCFDAAPEFIALVQKLSDVLFGIQSTFLLMRFFKYFCPVYEIS